MKIFSSLIKLFSVILLVHAGTAQLCRAEQIYKWVDKHGEVHYGSQPPAGAPVRQIHLPPGPTSEQQARARAQLDATLEAEQARQAAKQEAADLRAKQQADTAAQEKYCKQLQRRLEALTTLPMARIGTRGPDGQIRRVTEQEWQKGIKETRAAQEKFCK